MVTRKSVAPRSRVRNVVLDTGAADVLQGLDITNWGPAKESPVLAIELARAFVADLERRSCRIQFTREAAPLSHTRDIGSHSP